MSTFSWSEFGVFVRLDRYFFPNKELLLLKESGIRIFNEIAICIHFDFIRPAITKIIGCKVVHFYLLPFCPIYALIIAFMD